MKNFTLVINAVLVIAVAVLFYLFFSKPKAETFAASPAQSSSSFKIAYFEPDSLQTQFEYYTNVRNSLEAKQQEYSKQIDDMKRNLQSKAESFQQKYQNMSQAELAAHQNEIAASNQELTNLDREEKNKEQMLSQQLQDETFKKLQEIKKEIEDYLKEYNKNKGYAYIFAGSPDLMYYKDTSYNITADLVKGLNEKHKNKK
jgi:outer membrane protein